MDEIDADPNVIDLDDDAEAEAVAVDPEDVEDDVQPDSDVILAEESEAVAADNSDSQDNQAESAAENGENDGENNEAEKNQGEPLVDNPFIDDDDSDEDGGGVQVTIRKIEPTEKVNAVRQGKLDIDATPMINDKPIYDIDLAQMEDRPWRKPGADITDYFNYGFTEETWNMYCERQKKVRAEFSGNQAAANNSLFSSIKISNPLAHPVINNPSSSVVKVLTDNGGRFKQSSYNPPPPQANEQVIRTVITGNSNPAPPVSMAPPNSLMDFTKPPPGMSLPPMGMPPVSLPTSASEAPPGVESDRPPGVESAPGLGPSVLGVPGVPGVPGGLDLHLGLHPPMGFNPNMPPPGMAPGMPPLGMMSTNLPPPGFNMPPPSFQRAGFPPVNMGPPGGAPRSLMSSGPFGSRDLADEDEERRGSRRKRSRSRSPRRDRERDSRRTREHSDRTSTRRHRSTSGERRRRRDERERDKRRDRRDDDDRKKRSRRDDDDERRESSGRKEKSSRSSRAAAEDETAEVTGVKEESPDVE